MEKLDAPGLRRPGVRLHTYSGEQLEIIGEVVVRVWYETQVAKLPLIVVRGNGPNLLGRKLDEIDTFKLERHHKRQPNQSRLRNLAPNC